MSESTLARLPLDMPGAVFAGLLSRGLAVAGLVAIALVHLIQLPDTFRQSPGLGLLFTGLVVAASALGAAMVHSDRDALWFASALTAGATIAGYVMTRSIALPVDRADVGNWLEPVGLVALFLEGGLILLSVYRLRVVGRATYLPAEALGRR